MNSSVPQCPLISQPWIPYSPAPVFSVLQPEASPKSGLRWTLWPAAPPSIRASSGGTVPGAEMKSLKWMNEKHRGERKKAQDSVEEVPLLTGLSEQTYLWKEDADKAENLPTGKLKKTFSATLLHPLWLTVKAAVWWTSLKEAADMNHHALIQRGILISVRPPVQFPVDLLLEILFFKGLNSFRATVWYSKQQHEHVFGWHTVIVKVSLCCGCVLSQKRAIKQKWPCFPFPRPFHITCVFWLSPLHSRYLFVTFYLRSFMYFIQTMGRVCVLEFFLLSFTSVSLASNTNLIKGEFLVFDWGEAAHLGWTLVTNFGLTRFQCRDAKHYEISMF